MMTHEVAKQPQTTVYDLFRAQYTIPVPIAISKVYTIPIVRSLHKYNTLSFSHKTYSGAAKATVRPGLTTSYDLPAMGKVLGIEDHRA